MKYTWHELWLLFFSVLNVLVQVGVGIPLLVASADITLSLPVNGTDFDHPSDYPFQPFAFDVVVLSVVGQWLRFLRTGGERSSSAIVPTDGSRSSRIHAAQTSRKRCAVLCRRDVEIMYGHARNMFESMYACFRHI